MRQLGPALVAVLGLAACGGPDLGDAPDTRGMVLPDAQKVLKEAGYEATVKSDGAFGVVVPSHFVVCDEERINAQFVRLEVAKHGC
jgi:hypothetical protein